MLVIVGLGNPGLQYKETRHNIGFMVLDQFCRKHKLAFRKSGKMYRAVSFEFESEKVRFVKPQTYMNESGNAVRKAVIESGITDFSRLLVVSDDINLPFGTIRLRESGSAGGQKGLQSIIDHLGTNAFPRMRIGIGNHFSDAADYVLSRFSRKEQKDVPFILTYAVEALEYFISNGIELTMSKYNRNVLET
ncbi:MAG: aminoacyl-tRNA hydrolase [Calditrichaeota bacterium]|nr:aminoacyl-tRNA hydrolase [Calditrichota bacterium]RQV93366.1 MAG: aminoacyl-tRNA hydrolase [bacterium]RQW05698.1 MAG: aminoacyl-tRNA hydrolase [Calditrichota bacterium]